MVAHCTTDLLCDGCCLGKRFALVLSRELRQAINGPMRNLRKRIQGNTFLAQIARSARPPTRSKFSHLISKQRLPEPSAPQNEHRPQFQIGQRQSDDMQIQMSSSKISRSCRLYLLHLSPSMTELVTPQSQHEFHTAKMPTPSRLMLSLRSVIRHSLVVCPSVPQLLYATNILKSKGLMLSVRSASL